MQTYTVIVTRGTTILAPPRPYRPNPGTQGARRGYPLTPLSHRHPRQKPEPTTPSFQPKPEPTKTRHPPTPIGDLRDMPHLRYGLHRKDYEEAL